MTVAGHHVPVWYDEATGPTNGQGVFWNASTQRWESADVDISALDTAGLATDAALTAGLATKQNTIPPGTYGEADPVVSVTYNADGSVATSTENGITTTFTYNADGSVATTARLGVTRTYSYNTDGSLAGVA